MPTTGVPCRCDGSGKLHYEHHEHPDTARDLGDGLIGGAISTYGSHPCPCRSSLPPREGHARWWSSEQVYSATWEACVHRETVEVIVTSEVPYDEENYKVTLRGNRYFPTMVDVDLSAPALHSLHPNEVRELAALLIAAADKCDEIDEPCADECGHWFPCDCRSEPPTTEIPF